MAVIRLRIALPDLADGEDDVLLRLFVFFIIFVVQQFKLYLCGFLKKYSLNNNLNIENSAFWSFDESNEINELARDLNFSLNDELHPLCRLAASELQLHLQHQQIGMVCKVMQMKNSIAVAPCKKMELPILGA